MKNETLSTLKLFAFILFLCASHSSCLKQVEDIKRTSLELPSVPACPEGSEWNQVLRRCVTTCPSGYVFDVETESCIPEGGSNIITVNYAGVVITYDVNAQILGFNNVTDLNTVIDQLESENESHNANYESQYPLMDENQLDSMDVLNNFDEFKKLRDFEALFSGYSSKRLQIEMTEASWLNNNFTGTDPDALDFTYEDAENTVFNSSYYIKINNVLYEMRYDGLFTVSGGGQSLQSGANSLTNECIRGQKNAFKPHATNVDRKFKLKVAMNYSLIRSSAKGKVVSFKKKNGNWKRSRSEMAVGVFGTIYDNNCLQSLQLDIRNPSPNGFKKRKSLKIIYRFWSTIDHWTKPKQLGSSFSLSDNITYGSIVLD